MAATAGEGAVLETEADAAARVAAPAVAGDMEVAQKVAEATEEAPTEAVVWVDAAPTAEEPRAAVRAVEASQARRDPQGCRCHRKCKTRMSGSCECTCPC